jgi:hypothetical protein
MAVLIKRKLSSSTDKESLFQNQIQVMLKRVAARLWLILSLSKIHQMDLSSQMIKRTMFGPGTKI